MENNLHTPNPGKHHFILFVSGMSVKSGHAVENIRKICDTYLKDQFELEIVDIFHNPEQAVKYQIIGVPTLIRTNKEAPKIILGDLSDTQKVLKILDIKTSL